MDLTLEETRLWINSNLDTSPFSSASSTVLLDKESLAELLSSV